ncbi:MAG: guanylate kinase [Sedimentisphaerales bacterium]|nr:guanylate kinase [Sedimentisphaerales bacterium]
MTDSRKKKGKVVILSGPSGVGKSTICKEIIRRLDRVHLSVSMTTRPKSATEVDGRDYWFVSKKEFQERIDKGLLLEHAKVFGHFYGTPKDKVIESLQEGKIVILEIDVQGAIQAKAVFPDAIMIFILPPSAKTLAERLNHRGRDSADAAEIRLNGASDEIAAAWQHYKHMVINEDLQQAVNECVQIITNKKSDASV